MQHNNVEPVRPVPSTIRITLLYFGQTRDDSGRSEETFAVPEGSSVDVALERAIELHPRLARGRGSAQVALNEELADMHAKLKDGDVLALLPPVAGG